MTSKDEQDRIKKAESEIAEVCEKYDVNVVPYIHTFGPRLSIIPVNSEEQAQQAPGQDEAAGERTPKTGEQSVSKPVDKSKN